MPAQKKIVLIEDDKFLVKALTFQMETSGYELHVATDGETGLNLIKNIQPDIVLLDVMIPKMNGFEVMSNLKKNDSLKNIPVIFFSNLGQEEEIEKGKSLGAVDYIVKANIDLDQLVSKIDLHTS